MTSFNIKWLLLFFVITSLYRCKNSTENKLAKKSNWAVEEVISDEGPAIIKLTEGPKQHWFGYYDKWQIDPSGRYVLGCEVDTFLDRPRQQILYVSV